jgi:hypothetical protein
MIHRLEVKKQETFFLQEKKTLQKYMKLLLNSCFVQLSKIIIAHEQSGYLLESGRLQTHCLHISTF